MLFDYNTVLHIWWFLLGVLIIGFVVLDGFDIGVAILLPFLGKTPHNRQMMINTIAPVWESNQVWLIVSAGVVFAAWPLVYAVLFSTLYPLMFVLLLSLIVRPVGFKFREKIWKTFFDYCLFFSGILSAFFFGIMIGNLFTGVSFQIDAHMHIFSKTKWLDFFSFYTVLWGVLSVLALSTQGLAYLFFKTDFFDKKILRIKKYLNFLIVFCFFAIAFWNRYKTGYQIIDDTIEYQKGAWSHSFFLWPIMFNMLALCSFSFFSKSRHLVFVCSSLIMVHIVVFIGVSLYPFLLPSNFDPRSSLTIYNSSSSSYSLKIMLVSVVILLPIVLIYTKWMYRVFSKNDHKSHYDE